MQVDLLTIQLATYIGSYIIASYICVNGLCLLTNSSQSFHVTRLYLSYIQTLCLIHRQLSHSIAIYGYIRLKRLRCKSKAALLQTLMVKFNCSYISQLAINPTFDLLLLQQLAIQLDFVHFVQVGQTIHGTKLSLLIVHFYFYINLEKSTDNQLVIDICVLHA